MEIFSSPPLGTESRRGTQSPRNGLVGRLCLCYDEGIMSGPQVYLERRCSSLRFLPGASPRGFLLRLSITSGEFKLSLTNVLEAKSSLTAALLWHPWVPTVSWLWLLGVCEHLPAH